MYERIVLGVSNNIPHVTSWMLCATELGVAAVFLYKLVIKKLKRRPVTGDRFKSSIGISLLR